MLDQLSNRYISTAINHMYIYVKCIILDLVSCFYETKTAYWHQNALLYKFKFQSMFCYTNLRYRLGNDLYCVEWGVKLYSNQLRYRPMVILYCNVRCVHQFLPARIYASAILSMACVCLPEAGTV